MNTESQREHGFGRESSIFTDQYESSSLLFLPVQTYPRGIAGSLWQILQTEGLDILQRIETHTSRQIYVGRLSLIDPICPDLVFKLSRWEDDEHTEHGTQPVPEELRMNRELDRLVKSNFYRYFKTFPSYYPHTSVRVEHAVGMLRDKQSKDEFSVYLFEHGYDQGELLQYADPPMEGAINFRPREWRIYCAVKDVLDSVSAIAADNHLILGDIDVHQTLYMENTEAGSLDVVLIDSERLYEVPVTIERQ